MTKGFNGEYENKLTCPTKPKLICSQCNQTFFKGDNFCVKCGHNVRLEYSNALESYKANQNAYVNESKEIYERFTVDCLTAAGLIDHPKAREIFAYVVNREGDLGYENIYENVIDIADLFK